MTTHTRRPPVTVIGLGPMGQAMARALMAGGHPVTVWNRTPSRADGLVAEGATRADSPAAAVAASDLAILSLTDYQAMDDILGPVGPGLAGHTIVNLSSDTPERTRRAAAWAAGLGARFLTGGVMVPAPMVGTEAAYVYYSGPRSLVDQHAATLGLIGAPRYVGEDPGLAQLWYQAQLDVFLTALSGLLHATALAGSAGVTAAEFLPEALQTLADIPAMLARRGHRPEPRRGRPPWRPEHRHDDGGDGRPHRRRQRGGRHRRRAASGDQLALRPGHRCRARPRQLDQPDRGDQGACSPGRAMMAG